MPFDYSMHNYLLRYYLAEHGLDPDRDVQIRVGAAAGDGRQPARRQHRRLPRARPGQPARRLRRRRLHPHPLEGDLGRPSLLRFRRVQGFVTQYPDTYRALLKSIIDATAFATKAENRKQIAEAIAPANYLNQPVTVIEQVLTGTFADGLGNVRKEPEPYRFRSVPLALVRGVDSDADEALGPDQGRRRLHEGRREGVPRHRHREAHEGSWA